MFTRSPSNQTPIYICINYSWGFGSDRFINHTQPTIFSFETCLWHVAWWEICRPWPLFVLGSHLVEISPTRRIWFSVRARKFYFPLILYVFVCCNDWITNCLWSPPKAVWESREHGMFNDEGGKTCSNSKITLAVHVQFDLASACHVRWRTRRTRDHMPRTDPPAHQTMTTTAIPTMGPFCTATIRSRTAPPR